MMLCTDDTIHIGPWWSVRPVVRIRSVGICRTLRAGHRSHPAWNLASSRRRRFYLARTVRAITPSRMTATEAVDFVDVNSCARYALELRFACTRRTN